MHGSQFYQGLLVQLFNTMSGMRLARAKIFNMLVTYGLMAIVLSTVIPTTETAKKLGKNINDYQIGSILARPVTISQVMLGRLIGTLIYDLIYKLMPLTIIYAVFFRHVLQFNQVNMLILLLSVFLAWLIAWLIGMIIGFCAFITDRSSKRITSAEWWINGHTGWRSHSN